MNTNRSKDHEVAKLSRIVPEIPVYDLQAAIKYYEQKLGFRAALELPSGDYAIVERDDVAIHLFDNGARTHSTAGVHIFTHDLDDLHAEFQQRGAHVSQGIMRKPWGNREFRVRDDSGNEIKFTEPLDAE